MQSQLCNLTILSYQRCCMHSNIHFHGTYICTFGIRILNRKSVSQFHQNQPIGEQNITPWLNRYLHKLHRLHRSLFTCASLLLLILAGALLSLSIIEFSAVKSQYRIVPLLLPYPLGINHSHAPAVSDERQISRLLTYRSNGKGDVMDAELSGGAPVPVKPTPQPDMQ